MNIKPFLTLQVYYAAPFHPNSTQTTHLTFTFALKSTFTARNPSSTNSRQTPIRKRSPKREEILHPKRQHRQRTPNLPRIPIGSLIHKTKGIVWRKEIED